MADDETEMKEKEAMAESEVDSGWVLCCVWPAG